MKKTILITALLAFTGFVSNAQDLKLDTTTFTSSGWSRGYNGVDNFRVTDKGKIVIKGDTLTVIRQLMEFKGTQKDFFAIEYSGCWSIQDGQYYGESDVLNTDDVGEYEAEHNARLFAASKDLLNACIKALELSDKRMIEEETSERTEECQNVYDTVKSAIDKALGL